MAPFDRAYTTFYWSGIVSIALSCISSQINEIVVENRDFFSYPLHWTPPLAAPLEYCHIVGMEQEVKVI